MAAGAAEAAGEADVGRTVGVLGKSPTLGNEDYEANYSVDGYLVISCQQFGGIT